MRQLPNSRWAPFLLLFAVGMQLVLIIVSINQVDTISRSINLAKLQHSCLMILHNKVRLEEREQTQKPSQKDFSDAIESLRTLADSQVHDIGGANREGNDREGSDREGNDREGNDREGNDREGNDRDLRAGLNEIVNSARNLAFLSRGNQKLSSELAGPHRLRIKQISAQIENSQNRLNRLIVHYQGDRRHCCTMFFTCSLVLLTMSLIALYCLVRQAQLELEVAARVGKAQTADELSAMLRHFYRIDIQHWLDNASAAARFKEKLCTALELAIGSLSKTLDLEYINDYAANILGMKAGAQNDSVSLISFLDSFSDLNSAPERNDLYQWIVSGQNRNEPISLNLKVNRCRVTPFKFCFVISPLNDSILFCGKNMSKSIEQWSLRALTFQGIGHDLRTATTSALFAIEAQLPELSDESRNSAHLRLQAIRHKFKLTIALIDNYLLAEKLRSGKYRMEIEHVDIVQVIDAAFEEVELSLDLASPIELKRETTSANNSGQTATTGVLADLHLLIRAITSIALWTHTVKMPDKPLTVKLTSGKNITLHMQFEPLQSALIRQKSHFAESISLQSPDQLIQESLYLTDIIIQAHKGQLTYSWQNKTLMEVRIELPACL